MFLEAPGPIGISRSLAVKAASKDILTLPVQKSISPCTAAGPL